MISKFTGVDVETHTQKKYVKSIFQASGMIYLAVVGYEQIVSSEAKGSICILKTVTS